MPDHAHFEPEALKHVDPLALTHSDFDWPELERLLGESKELNESDRKLLATVFHELLRWAINSDSKQIRLETVGRRLIALAWVINPDLFEGGPSATKLAKMIGCHPVTLQCDTGDASRSFGLRNRAQSHVWNNKPRARKASTR